MTQQKSLFEQIEQELRNSSDTLERLQQENKNPSLETDLLREQVVRLYEHVVKLQKEIAAPNEGAMADEDQAYKQMQSFAELHQQFLEYQKSQNSASEEESTEDASSPLAKESGEQKDAFQTAETSSNPHQTEPDDNEPEQNEQAVTSNEEATLEQQPESSGAFNNEGIQEDAQEAGEQAPGEDPAEKKQSINTNKSSKDEDSGQSLLDKFKASSKSSLHERFQEKNQQRVLSDKLKQTPISDLKSAIPVNQKIAFVENLFNGDQKVYKKTIDFIDKCKNYSEAKMYMQSKIKDKYDWTDEDEYVQEFMNYVYRKFLS